MDVARAKISFNNVAMIGYLVKELNEKYPDAQVGKTRAGGQDSGSEDDVSPEQDEDLRL